MQQPGTSLGTFAVTGTLATQTCGSGVSPDNPWKFAVRLSRGTNILYWLQDSAPPVSGFIDDKGNASITSSSTYVLQEAGDAGAPYCGVVRTDNFKAALGTGTPSSFSGTLSYHYEVDQGADCTALLPAAGYGAMPCDVGYKIAATRSQ